MNTDNDPGPGPHKVTGIRVEFRSWNGETKQAEIKSYKDNEHYHLEVTGGKNGHLTYIVNGTSRTVTRDGQIMYDKSQGSYSIREECLCAVLREIYGIRWSGYEHNYILKDDHVTEEE